MNYLKHRRKLKPNFRKYHRYTKKPLKIDVLGYSKLMNEHIISSTYEYSITDKGLYVTKIILKTRHGSR